VHELRGEAVVSEVEPELSFDVEAYLPEEHVADIGVRARGHAGEPSEGLLVHVASRADGEHEDLPLRAAHLEDDPVLAHTQAVQAAQIAVQRRDVRGRERIGALPSQGSVHLPDDPGGKPTVRTLRAGMEKNLIHRA
jgi:hypothetical protein